MKIEILGTRGEIEPTASYHSHHSGVLVDQRLLLDVGEREFLQRHVGWILITHLHPDHAFFVRDAEERAEIEAPVYAPEASAQIEVNVLTDDIELGAYRIVPIPTIHSLKVKSQAYVIDDARHRILYTGDLVWIETRYRDRFGHLDLVITDGSYIRKGGLVRKDRATGHLYGHQGIPNLVRLFKPYTAHVMFVHFGSWFYKGVAEARAKVEQIAKEEGVDVIVGYDGMEIDLDELTKDK